jgi:hypothetical protein
LSGRPSSQADIAIHSDGTLTVTEEKTWGVPGATETLTFYEEMIQRYLDEISAMLSTLSKAAREFAESNQPAKAAQA